ncbi:sensor histidine kinase [Paenibacillus sp. 598K]|uniref:sensor histidine kinase n=1 Tax=Paenibacillus sp. 598K TaxID=1117987 RepID=UPI000FF9036F|nr:histidine kinase [Paenibacillus sp. 598K]GBF76409.1 sensor histidine kinase [Paenibacillus sp. 598K]
MKRSRPIFYKINGVILILLIPAVFLYTYFSTSSVQVIDAQMKAYKESQLLFLKSQIESNIERLSLSSNVLARDSSILDLYISILTKDYLRMIEYQTLVKEKLYLQSFSSHWSNELAVYLPAIETRISTNLSSRYDESVLERSENGVWTFQPGRETQAPAYQMLIWDPYLSKDQPGNVNAVFEVRFGIDNVRQMLRQYNADNPGHSFLLTESGEVFADSGLSDELYAGLGSELLAGGLDGLGSRNLTVDGQDVYLSYTAVPHLGAWLIDYVPLEQFHAPIIKSRNLFYISMAALVILGFFASYLLYLHVQKPLSTLIRGLKQFEMGDYAYRIHQRFHNEFDYMMHRFNDMGREIQHLIQNVYEEQHRSRLATLKQLQSQINPHFLYNCLSFIAACAKAGETTTIKEMAYHLGGYYRYTTRVENQSATLKEEIELVRHYLQIYTYRLERVKYRIEVPEEMLAEEGMRLIVQPVVENAIMHGVEPKPGPGLVVVRGRREAGWTMLQVEDSGVGMTESAIQAYVEQLELPMSEETGCGLWNVHQRLKIRYGADAGVTIERSADLGGLLVTLRWRTELTDKIEHTKRAEERAYEPNVVC